MSNYNTHERYLLIKNDLVDSFFSYMPEKKKRGRPKKYSDALILKLWLIMHLCRLDGETHLIRHVKRYYADCFPVLPDQSRLWYRIRQILVTAELFRHYISQLFRLTIDKGEYLFGFKLGSRR